jgi:CRP-like cAMP-binding protein
MKDELTNTKHFSDGTVLLSEGKSGKGVFIIEEGTVKITRTSKDNQDILLAELGQGQVFGEMSLIDESPCSANVIADGDLTVRILNKTQFFTMLQTDMQSVQSVMEVLFQRMRAMNKRVVELEQQITSLKSQQKAPKSNVIEIRGISEPAKHALFDINAIVVDESPFSVGRWSKKVSESSWFSKKPERKHVEIHDIPPYVVSRLHFQIKSDKKGVYVIDTSSRLGTWVNGEKINQHKLKQIQLKPGENTVHLGGLDSQFVFEISVP